MIKKLKLITECLENGYTIQTLGPSGWEDCKNCPDAYGNITISFHGAYRCKPRAIYGSTVKLTPDIIEVLMDAGYDVFN